MFGIAQQWRLAQQGAHAIEPDFGRGLEPAEGSDPGEMSWQHVLQEPAQELERVQFDGGELAGFALAKGPQHLAIGQEFDLAIGGGGRKAPVGATPLYGVLKM